MLSLLAPLERAAPDVPPGSKTFYGVASEEIMGGNPPIVSHPAWRKRERGTKPECQSIDDLDVMAAFPAGRTR
jgi:hypothetical protein